MPCSAKPTDVAGSRAGAKIIGYNDSVVLPDNRDHTRRLFILGKGLPANELSELQNRSFRVNYEIIATKLCLGYAQKTMS